MAEEKKDSFGKWVLAGFAAALGAFLFEIIKNAGKKLAEPTEED